MSPEGSRFKVRPERGMVSSCAIEGGESPTRLMVTVLEDREMGELLVRVLQKVPPTDLEKSICVVDRKRIRVTRLPFARKP
jgi:hypothetical protein